MKAFLVCILLIAIVGIRMASSKGKKCKCEEVDKRIAKAFENCVPLTEFEEFQKTILDRLEAIETEQEEEPSTDCYDLKNKGVSESGVYSVVLKDSGKQMDVYCDMETLGGGWTVFQSHVDDSVDFYRNFLEYEQGFGDVNSGNYWIGLKSVNEMTQDTASEIYFKFVDKDDVAAYEQYSGFWVESGPGYTLHLGSVIYNEETKTNVWNLLRHNGQKFSTKDKDQDSAVSNCAENRHGGFWYEQCGGINPNGDYATPGTKSQYGWKNRGGMVHVGWRGDFSLKLTKMMFRRLN